MHQYAPWLLSDALLADDPASSLSMNPRHTSAFLQSTQWILALRHLSELPFSSQPKSGVRQPAHYEDLRIQLHTTLHRRLMRAVFCRDLSLTALRALGILATWPSAFVSGTPRGEDSSADTGSDVTFDPELMHTIMLKIANLMHLEHDVSKAVEFDDSESRCAPECVEILERARMVSPQEQMCNV